MKKRVIIFLAVCFSISLITVALFKLVGGTYSGLAATLLGSVYMLMPLISVLITQLIVGEAPFSNCGISFKFNWWWLFALLSMPVFVLLTLPVSAILPGVAISGNTPLVQQSIESMKASGLSLGPIGLLLISLGSGLVAGCTINALFAFCEEVAWRGFLSNCFDKLGFWKKTLLVGFIWGVWHAPIILMGHNYPEHPVAGVFMMIAFCMLFAPIIQLVRDKSGSVVAAAIAHGSLNAAAGLAIIYLSGFNDLTCGPNGAAGFVILLIANIIIAMIQAKRGHAKNIR